MLLAAWALAACTTSVPEDTGGLPSRELAGRPASLAPVPGTSGSPSASVTASGSAPGRPGASSLPPGATAVPSASATAPAGGSSTPPSGSGSGSGQLGGPYHAVGSVEDRQRDAGTGVPGYGDLFTVTLEDDGTYARVTVRMAGAFPASLPAEESMGIGVEFYRTRLQNESDYQLFADGQPDGWFAYLHTPRGFVRYPGTFGIGGDRLVFTVPWSALGKPTTGTFAAFADWSRQATPTNRSGEDRVPELTREPYSR